MTESIICQPHDHRACIAEALDRAQAVCQRKGARLTPLRKTVLELVWQSHKPLGAYALMSMLEQEDTRKVAPPTVYRALDFLLEHGLIHRVHRLNAYIGCPDPEQPHAGNLLICRECGVALEADAQPLDQALQQLAADHGFSAEEHTLEIVGLCRHCQGRRCQGQQGQTAEQHP